MAHRATLLLWFACLARAIEFSVPYDADGSLHGKVWRANVNATNQSSPLRACTLFIPGGPSFPLVDTLSATLDTSALDFDFVTFDFCATGISTCSTQTGLQELAKQAEAMLDAISAPLGVCGNKSVVVISYSAAADTLARLPPHKATQVIFFLPFVNYMQSVMVRNQCLSEYVWMSNMLPEIIRRALGFLFCGYYCPSKYSTQCASDTLVNSWLPDSIEISQYALQSENFRLQNFKEYSALDLTSHAFTMNRTAVVVSDYDFIAPAAFGRQMFDVMRASCKIFWRVQNQGHFTILSNPSLFLKTIDEVLHEMDLPECRAVKKMLR